MTVRFSKMVAKLPRFQELHKIEVDGSPTSQEEMEKSIRVFLKVDGVDVELAPSDWGFTFADVMAKDAEVKSEALAKLREKRNELLAETDKVTMSCYSRGIPVPADWASYQQALRDLPSNASADFAGDGSLIGFVWPTQPNTKP